MGLNFSTQKKTVKSQPKSTVKPPVKTQPSVMRQQTIGPPLIPPMGGSSVMRQQTIGPHLRPTATCEPLKWGETPRPECRFLPPPQPPLTQNLPIGTNQMLSIPLGGGQNPQSISFNYNFYVNEKFTNPDISSSFVNLNSHYSKLNQAYPDLSQMTCKN